MQNPRQKPTPTGAQRNAGIWLAWAVALGFHAIILWFPFRGENPVTLNVSALIELQLTNFTTTHVPPPTEQIPETPLPENLPEEIIAEEIIPEELNLKELLPEAVPETTPEPVYSVVDEQPEVNPEKTEPPLLTSTPLVREMKRDLENMSAVETSQLTNAVLARQFITGESDPDRIFGWQVEPGNTEGQKEFHYPLRQSMISMLDKPLPDIPFAYEEGLIYFAYDPGVKGDLQRFWDVITPEFGWRTRYGTEVKCIWVLVIAACGWK